MYCLSSVLAGGMTIISRLVQIHKMDKRSKLEEEREQQVPSSPTILPASPVPEGMDKTTAQISSGDEENVEDSITRQRRRSSSNRLQRQEKSVREGEIDCVFLVGSVHNLCGHIIKMRTNLHGLGFLELYIEYSISKFELCGIEV